jgi:hypothetical protein
MISISRWSIKVNFNFIFNIICTEHLHINLELIPILLAPFIWFDLRLIHRLELSWRQILPNQKENWASIFDRSLQLHDDSLRISGHFLFTCNFDDSWLVLGSSVVKDWGFQSLVFRCDNLMQLEIEGADVLLSFQIGSLGCIIHIICLD